MRSDDSFHNSTDQELAVLCLQHDRTAWEEFFRRFSPLIKKAIRRTFIKYCARELASDMDNICDIHAAIVEKLYAKGVLHQCRDLSGLRAWIIRLSANQTLDWLKHRGRIKNSPAVDAENAVSLSTTLGEDGQATLQDILEDMDADIWALRQMEAQRLYLDNVLEQLASLNNSTQRWILRLSILAQMSLAEQERAELEAFSPLGSTVLCRLLEEMESELAESEMKRQAALGRSVVYWHQLRRMEAQIAFLQRDPSNVNNQRIGQLVQECAELETLRNKAMKDGRVLARPSNRQIAAIVGILEEKCGNVSKYLERARETVRDKLGDG